MPLRPFQGQTFVAFIDISGFKKMMVDEERAVEALNKFYSYGYWCLERVEDVQGFFVSDCGILFSTKIDDYPQGLKSLLSVIKELNIRMCEDDLMLTSSIAFGHFSYDVRQEFVGITKMPIYGNGYVAAFADNEIGRPKLQPGQCRLVLKDLPFEKEILMNNDDREFMFFAPKTNDPKHFYYYWMVNNPQQIRNFEKDFDDAKYIGIMSLLRGYGA
jgi:hypothetical protein